MSGSLVQPIVNWQVKSDFSDAGFEEHKVLIIGQADGTALNAELKEDVKGSEISTLVGAGSMLDMAYRKFRRYNKASEVSVIPLKEPPNGTKAEGGLKFTGEATINEDVKLKVFDDDFEVSFVIEKGDTADVIAQKTVDAINNADTWAIASIDAGDNTLVKLEFKYVGEVGNDLVVSVVDRISGVDTSSIKTSGGAGAYDIGTVLDTLAERYQTVIFDDTVDYNKIEALLESRVNPVNNILSGVGLYMKQGTHTDVKNFVKQKNAKTMVCFGNIEEMKYTAVPLLAMVEVGAKRALRLTAGAILDDLVVEAQEAYGGIDKASLPYHNTPMDYMKPKGLLSVEDAKDLNDEGVSLFVPSTAKVVLGSVVTTYKYDNSGERDETFKYLNAVDTTFAIQEYLFRNCKKKFAQTRATTGDLLPHVAMTNVGSVKAEIVGMYDYLMGKALAQSGKDAIKAFKNGVYVDLDISKGLYSVEAPVAIVSQFRGLNGVAKISYTFN